MFKIYFKDFQAENEFLQFNEFYPLIERAHSDLSKVIERMRRCHFEDTSYIVCESTANEVRNYEHFYLQSSAFDDLFLYLYFLDNGFDINQNSIGSASSESGCCSRSF